MESEDRFCLLQEKLYHSISSHFLDCPKDIASQQVTNAKSLEWNDTTSRSITWANARPTTRLFRQAQRSSIIATVFLSSVASYRSSSWRHWSSQLRHPLVSLPSPPRSPGSDQHDVENPQKQRLDISLYQQIQVRQILVQDDQPGSLSIDSSREGSGGWYHGSTGLTRSMGQRQRKCIRCDSKQPERASLGTPAHSQPPFMPQSYKSTIITNRVQV